MSNVTQDYESRMKHFEFNTFYKFTLMSEIGVFRIESKNKFKKFNVLFGKSVAKK